jgi:hypothetical protein
MKFLLLGFLTYLAAVGATDSLTQTVTEAISKGVTAAHLRRGLKDPLEMTYEEHERETFFVCSIINGVLPSTISCDCTTMFFSLSIGFTCASSEYGCIPIPVVGDLCSSSSVSGQVGLNIGQLALNLNVLACADNALLNRTDTNSGEIETTELGDICANIGMLAGLGGASITDCSVNIRAQTCESCTSCLTGSNSTGLQFSCPGLIDVCIPINIPIFVRELNPDLTLSEAADAEAWGVFATEIAIQVAEGTV